MVALIGIDHRNIHGNRRFIHDGQLGNIFQIICNIFLNNAIKFFKNPRSSPVNKLKPILLALLVLLTIPAALGALQVTTLAPSEVDICNSTQYKIDVNNTGSTVNNITANITLPIGFSYMPGTTSITLPSPSRTSTQEPTLKSGRYLNWNLSRLIIITPPAGNPNGYLGSGESLSVKFNLTAACNTSSGQILKSNVTYLGGYTQSASLSSITINQGFLSVIEEPNVVGAGMGDTANWTILIQNSGTGPAYNVSAKDTLYSGLSLISIDSPTGTTNWHYDKINASETKTVHVSTRVISCSNLYNLINLSWGCSNVCQKTYAIGSVKFIERTPLILCSFTPEPISVPYGSKTTVTFTGQNIGTGEAYDMHLDFKGFPSDYVITNVTGATYYSGNNTFYLGNCPGGGSKSFTFDFQILPGTCSPSSGVFGTLPHYFDACGHLWAPPTHYALYGLKPGTAPTLSISKSGPTSIYLGQTATYLLNLSYINNSCPGRNITRNITDIYPANFQVIDNAGGIVNPSAHEINWMNQIINDTGWSRAIILKAADDPCDCGTVVTNTLQTDSKPNCYGCLVGGNSSLNILVKCYNSSLFTSNKTAWPANQENCRNITYNNTYIFNNVGSLKWGDIGFTERGGNGQFFYGSGQTGVATFRLDDGACSTDHNITLGHETILDFLENSCPSLPLHAGSKLEIIYALHKANTGSFNDWSDLNVTGSPSNCSGNQGYHDEANVSVGRSDFSLGLSYAIKMESCGIYPLNISLTKNGPYSGYGMNVTYNDTDFRYLSPCTISGITNQSGLVMSFEPLRSGNILTWNLGSIVSSGGAITFNVEKRCPPDKRLWAGLTYFDNCGTPLSSTAIGSPLLLDRGNIFIKKTPEVIYALTKNLSWNIYVVNPGSGTSYNTQVFDSLTPGLAYKNSTIDGKVDSANTTVVGQDVTWMLGNMSPAATRLVELNATLTGCNNLYNSVRATWGCNGGYCNETTDNSTVVLPPTSMSVIKHNVGLVDKCGANTTITLGIKNVDRTTAYNVNVSETLPPGLMYVPGSVKVTGGLDPTTEVLTGNPLYWRFDQPSGWAPGTEVYITFNISVTGYCNFSGGPAIAKANFTTPCGRYGPQAVGEIYVNPAKPHLSISKNPSLSSMDKNDVVRWTLTLNSDGDYEAKNITLTDLLPDNTDYLDSDPAITSGDGHTSPLVWDFRHMNMTPGSTRKVLLNATVHGCAADSHDTATVYWGCCPTALESSTAQATLMTQPAISLSMSSDTVTTCGGNITLVIRNDGSTALIKNITEIMPSGFVYKKLSAVITSDNATHNHTIGNYEPIDYSLINRTLRWNSTNIDRIYHGETISIKFQLINCVNCCSSVSTSNNILKVNVTDSCFDPFFASRSDSVTPRKALLAVRKEPSVQHLGNVKWTLYIDNSGDEAASNVSITDVLGDGFTNIVVQPNDGTQIHNKPYPNFTTINWTHQTVPQGIGTWQRIITARANDTCGLNHTNNVTVRGTCPSGCVYSNTSTVAYAWSSAVYELDSMETMLRGQTDLISSFEALLKSTPMDANASVKFLKSFDDLSSRQQVELNTFKDIISCNWYDLNQSQRIKLSSSFEDLLRRQSNILSSNDDLLKMGFCNLSAANKSLFLNNFESRIEYEQTLLTSFTNLINRQGNLKTSEVQVWNSFLASLEDLIRRQAMILASFQELNKFSCDGSHLTIFKEVNTTSVISGGHVRYNITVTNTGDKNITNITINDYILGVIQGPPGITLKPGKNKTYSNITNLTCKNCSNCQCVVCNFATACGNVTGNPIIPICTVSNDVCVSVSQLGAGPVYPGGAMNKRQVPSADLAQDSAKSAGKLDYSTSIAGDNQGTKCSICGHKSAH